MRRVEIIIQCIEFQITDDLMNGQAWKKTKMVILDWDKPQGTLHFQSCPIYWKTVLLLFTWMEESTLMSLVMRIFSPWYVGRRVLSTNIQAKSQCVSSRDYQRGLHGDVSQFLDSKGEIGYHFPWNGPQKRQPRLVHSQTKNNGCPISQDISPIIAHG